MELNLGPMLRFLKIFSQKNLAKKSAFLPEVKGYFAEKVVITLVFEKNANFFSENWQKSKKIVIITSTPVPAFHAKYFSEQFGSTR
jgi:hypothetical protein